MITQQDVSMITQKHTIEHEDPLEPAPDIEIPPPMPVQDHTIALGTTEITEKFVSVWLIYAEYFIVIHSFPIFSSPEPKAHE